MARRPAKRGGDARPRADRCRSQATAALTSNGGYNKLGTTSETLDGSLWGVGYGYDLGNQLNYRS